jgi:endonuclease G
MKHWLFALLFVTNAALAFDQVPPGALKDCKEQAPLGMPEGKTGVGICRMGYATLNDTAAKIPVWATYILRPANALGCVPRSNAFATDASLPKELAATPSDYSASGYDRGHNVPDGDQSYNQQVEYESFLMTNMMPQAPSINRGIWKLLETSVRGWAVQTNQPQYIYSGPIYDQAKNKTIGANKVTVPHGFYKIVINTITLEYAGWTFPNEGDLGNDLTKLRTPVTQIAKLTGLSFPLPATGKELALDKAWPIDFGALTKAKRDKCGKDSD